MSYYDYYGRPSSGPSHPQAGGDSNNGSFGQGLSFYDIPTHVPESSTVFNTVHGNRSSSHSTQQYPQYVQQQYHTSPQQQTQAAYGQATSYHSSSYQQPPPDPRYPSGQAYNHHRASPSNLPDPRRLAPLQRVGEDRYQSSQYYSHDLQAQPTTNEMRSPHVYSPAGYPHLQSLTHTHTTSPYLPNSSGRGSMPVAAPANLHNHHQSMSIGPSLDRTPHIARSSAQLPYPRSAPQADMLPPLADYGPSSDSAEPTLIKKKRKRADARQLEVLNATYNRTAFPSTEERAALAKQLEMSARSVQIWFKNKRHAMRQGGCTTTGTPATNPVSNPFPVPVLVPTPTPPVARYRDASPAGYLNASPAAGHMMQQSGNPYTSRSPPSVAVRVQTSSTPGGRSRADDPRRNWPRGY
ncbi:hypothetical protein EI94DRAFT_1735783 [Lactarius quietus]|nr:hypothetical protein EI94DRAFT_1735783 [Lactarius quietus]